MTQDGSVDFALSRTSVDSIECVEVKGEIDVNTSPAVIGLIRKAFADGATRIMLDLSGVTFVDSSGIAAVVAANLEARERDARFACVPGSLLERFERMGLSAVLELHPTRDHAVAKLNG